MGSPAADEPSMGPDRVRHILHLAYAGSVAGLTGIQLVTPALPAIQEALRLSDVQIGLVTSLYLLPGVLLAAPIGLLADRVGRRPVFCTAILLLGGGGIVLLMVHDVGTLFAVRVVQGAAFAALLPITATMIGDVVKGREQVRAQANRNIIMETGDAALPLIGGALVGLAWFAPFSVQVLCLPLAVIGWWVIEDGPKGPSSERNLRGLFAVLRTRVGIAIQVAGVLRFLLRFSIISYLPILLSDRGSGPFIIAVIVAAPAVSGIVGALFVSRTIARFRPSSVMVVCLVVMVFTLVAMSALPGADIALTMMVIFGVADVMYAVLQTSIMVSFVDDTHRAGFVAVNGAVRNFGKFLAPTLIGVLLLVVSLAHAFIILAGLALIAVPTSLTFRSLDRALQEPGPAP